MSVKLDAEDIAVNEAVARITGLSKKFFAETSSAVEPAFDAAPSPLDELRQPVRHVQEFVQRAPARGDNADYAPNMPPKEQASQPMKAPKQRMPPKKPTGDMYGVDDQDSDPETIVPKRTAESRMSKPSNHMESFVSEYLGSMDEFRHWSGLSVLTEGETGPVPTPGVDKDNKTKGGLPGLQGQPLQDVEPEDGPPGDDDGTDKETTLDQAIAMLKKEGIDTDELWDEFLEQRGLSVALFNQLVDEAMESDDAAEMDELLAVEGLFAQALPYMLPEGLGDFFGKKKANDMSSLKQAKGVMAKHGKAAVRAANARGMSVEKMGKMKKVAESKVVLTRKRPLNEGYTFEATDDELNSMVWPRDYRKSAMEGMMGKYGLSEGKWIQKAVGKNKGLLHKKLGVPQSKKISAKKLNAASRAGGKLAKEANLAKTLKKFSKK